jgi:hypothetical protein
MVALIGSPVLSGGPFLFVFKTCARRPPSIVLKRMAVARGAWVAGPDRGQFVTVRGSFFVAGAPGYRVKLRSFRARFRGFRAAHRGLRHGCMGHVFDK